MPEKKVALENNQEDPQIEEKSPTPPPLSAKSFTKNPLFNFLAQFLVVGVIFFLIGYAVGGKSIQLNKQNTIPKFTISNKYPQTPTNVDFSLFWEVMDVLPEKYLDKSAVDGNKILYGAISGMVRSLGDPYTAFLDPKQNEAVRDELAGSFSGVGIQIGFNKEKRLSVIAPIRGTPADREGILAKDFILKIDDKDTFDMTLPEAVDLIRGAAGTKVKLVLGREGVEKPIEKNIERAQITVKSVEVSYKEKNGGQIAVLTVSRFGDKTDEEWDKAVSEILSKNVRGVVVDMRNNPGGLLTSAIHLGSEFVGSPIVKQQIADGSIKELPSDHVAKLAKIPMVVLINGGSASASEIFAGAIQDNKRGKIVGEKSFGKGTVQDVIDLPGGSGLHITIAKWLTPKGTSIHGAGITPDISVELKTEDKDKNQDPQLDKAIDAL